MCSNSIRFSYSSCRTSRGIVVGSIVGDLLRLCHELYSSVVSYVISPHVVEGGAGGDGEEELEGHGCVGKGRGWE